MSDTNKDRFNELAKECRTIIRKRASGQEGLERNLAFAQAKLEDAQTAKSNATSEKEIIAADKAVHEAEVLVEFHENALSVNEAPPYDKVALDARRAIINAYARELTDNLRNKAEAIVNEIAPLALEYEKEMDKVEECADLLRRASLASDLIGSMAVAMSWPHFGRNSMNGQGWQRQAFTQILKDGNWRTVPLWLAIWDVIEELLKK